MPSGPGMMTLLSWNNANILPLYAVEIEPAVTEPYKTRADLARTPTQQEGMVESGQYYIY